MSLFTSASLILTPNGYKSGKLYSIVPSTGLGDLSFTRATSASRVNSSGLIEHVLTGVPRLDYSGSVPHWLLEPQRTNLVVSSNLITNWSSNFSATKTYSHSVRSPQGLLNDAALIQCPATPGSGYYQFPGNVLANSTYTFSVYIRNFSSTSAVQIGCDSNTPTAFLIVNAVTGEVTSTGGGLISYQVINSGNGWYRVIGTFTSLTSNPSFVIYNNAPAAASFTVYGAQFELGSYATSYIPTIPYAETRNVDVISSTGIGDLIGQTEGTLYTEVAPMSTVLGPTTPVLYIQSADGTSALMLYLDSYGGTFHYTLQIIKNGSAGYASDGITITNTNFTKLALRYKVGEISLWKDGIKTFTYTNPTYTAFPFTPQFEQYLTVGGYGSSVIGTKLKGLQFYKTALSDAECIALTTL